MTEVLEHMRSSCDEEWLLNIHQLLPADKNWMLELASASGLLQHLRRHLGPEIALYCSQICVKSAKRGCHVPWHQDGDASVRTVWIVLDEITSASGGLRVKPKLHLAGRQPLKTVSNASELETATYFAKNNVYSIDTARCRGFADTETYTYALPAGGAGWLHLFTVLTGIIRACIMNSHVLRHRNLDHQNLLTWH